jgi:hypothetical protein
MFILINNQYTNWCIQKAYLQEIKHTRVRDMHTIRYQKKT